MQLTIISPERIIFKGKVDLINVPGKKGQFAVLRNHAPIISTLVKGEVVYKTGGNEYKISVASGMIEVNNNNVTVCVESTTDDK
jgi:F-type H+-transporting ATPase subunit epsilon